MINIEQKLSRKNKARGRGRGGGEKQIPFKKIPSSQTQKTPGELIC